MQVICMVILSALYIATMITAIAWAGMMAGSTRSWDEFKFNASLALGVIFFFIFLARSEDSEEREIGWLSLCLATLVFYNILAIWHFTATAWICLIILVVIWIIQTLISLIGCAFVPDPLEEIITR